MLSFFGTTWNFSLYVKKFATESIPAKYRGMREFGDWPLVAGRLGQQDIEFPTVSLIVQAPRATVNLQLNIFNLYVGLICFSSVLHLIPLLVFLFNLTCTFFGTGNRLETSRQINST